MQRRPPTVTQDSAALSRMRMRLRNPRSARSDRASSTNCCSTWVTRLGSYGGLRKRSAVLTSDQVGNPIGEAGDNYEHGARGLLGILPLDRLYDLAVKRHLFLDIARRP